MILNYLKVAWRMAVRTIGYSGINIGGLAIGMTVSILIGLWVHDELSFNKYHENYDSIVQLWRGETDPDTQVVSGGLATQYALAGTLKNDYQHYFKHVLRSWWTADYTLATPDKKFRRRGKFMDPAVIEVLTLDMIRGNNTSLNVPGSVIISTSAANAFFGSDDPIGKTLRIDNKIDVQVSGVYADLPENSTFRGVQFFGTFEEIEALQPWIGKNPGDWENTTVQLYAQLQPTATVESTNAAIRDVFLKYFPADLMKVEAKYNPFLQVVPMETWHLYSEFKNGKPAGGRITFVWLFGTICIFVLLLAAINFTNLSTARSEKRAKEVGIRKTVGSLRSQLIVQFLSEAFMVAFLAFLLALVFVTVSMDLFNSIAGKRIALPFGNLAFWGFAILFLISTTLLAGVYPAFFLSSFAPASTLKGIAMTTRSWPRKMLVVVQFTVSTTLMIGTLIVYQQVQYAQNRPVGYDRHGLIFIEMTDPDYKGKEDIIQNELLSTGVVASVSFSSSPLTSSWYTNGGFDWRGRDPKFDARLAVYHITPEFGRTLNWRLAEGRDFSPDTPGDTIDAVIINQTAADYMGFEHAVGEKLTDFNSEDGVITWTKTIIGVVEDMVTGSPYEAATPTIFYFKRETPTNIMNIRINTKTDRATALQQIQRVVKSIVPNGMFDYKFVDDEYAGKFDNEERVGALAGVFATLAIFISCLGLFGLASFVAERRFKEIGIRKVMGASVTSLWRMLSKGFIRLVIISCFLAVPAAYWLMDKWLTAYEYRTQISWWVFGISCISTIGITLLTVSYQSIKAATMNPVNSLRSE